MSFHVCALTQISNSDAPQVPIANSNLPERDFEVVIHGRRYPIRARSAFGAFQRFALQCGFPDTETLFDQYPALGAVRVYELHEGYQPSLQMVVRGHGPLKMN